MGVLPCHTNVECVSAWPFVACSLGVCVNRRAVREACIYRNTWVHFRYLIGVVDYPAEDSLLMLSFFSINLCCFIKNCCCCCCQLLCKLVSSKTGQRCKSVREQAACQQVAVKSCGSGCGSITANTLCGEVCRGPDSSWIPVCVPLMRITRHSWYLIKWALWDRMSLIFSWSILKISQCEHQLRRKFF